MFESNLIGKLQLKEIGRETVFVKWTDKSGTTSTLGSCLPGNGQKAYFLMIAYLDTKGQIHIHFKLEVFAEPQRTGKKGKASDPSTKKQKKTVLLVVPPDATFEYACTPRPISSIDGLSHDIFAIQNAGLSNADHVHLLQFNLTTKGFVVAEQKVFKPHSKTSYSLLRNLESLSKTTIFSVYIRPSNYATATLQELHTQTEATTIDTPTLKELYIEQNVELLKWDKLVCPGQTDQIPPQYAQPHSEVQVPRSPPQYTPLSREKQASQSPLVIPKETIKGTPQFPTSSNSTSVHGIFSGCEDSSDSEDFTEHIRTDFGVGSDEEELAKEQSASLNFRELNQQVNYDSKVSRKLNTKLEKWLERALSTNSNIYRHSRLANKLSALGDCVRSSNTYLFDMTLLWCSALFFYDPLDSDSKNARGLWENRNSWFINDIREQIQWANRMCSNTEMSSSSFEHFEKLGKAARTVALDMADKCVYHKQQSMLIAYILVSHGTLSGKPVPRKGLEAGGSESKRLKL